MSTLTVENSKCAYCFGWQKHGWSKRWFNCMALVVLGDMELQYFWWIIFEILSWAQIIQFFFWWIYFCSSLSWSGSGSFSLYCGSNQDKIKSQGLYKKWWQNQKLKCKVHGKLVCLIVHGNTHVLSSYFRCFGAVSP